MRQKYRIIRDWLFVVLIYLGVLLLMPVSDKIFPHLNPGTVDRTLNFIINVSIGVTCLILLFYLICKKDKAVFSQYAWLCVIFASCVYFLTKVETTMDRLHFVGYGILSLVIFFALRHNFGTMMLYLWSFLIVTVFAVFDELLQLSNLGGHNFELKDIATDCFSIFIGQLLIATVIRPKLEKVNIKLRKYTNYLTKLRDYSKSRLPKKSDF
ncbi:MAG: VanZ family protein [Candidatus Omnitrophica bacterium]|nr:VanZ family protein [Candidatus Omnitrophota bacterium]